MEAFGQTETTLVLGNFAGTTPKVGSMGKPSPMFDVDLVDPDGNPVKGIKRHPNIGNHVVIYANATILGGNTTIGDGCTIGGNVWLTKSVPAGQTVYYRSE